MSESRRPPRRGRGRRPSSAANTETSENPYRDEVEAGSATLPAPEVEPPTRERNESPPPAERPARRHERPAAEPEAASSPPAPTPPAPPPPTPDGEREQAG